MANALAAGPPQPANPDFVEDVLVSTLPIYFSDFLSPHIQLHQFPLLTRPLEVPPSASAAGKHVKARIKPKVSRMEIHVPVDTRPEVWNRDKSKDLGLARMRDDAESLAAAGGVKKNMKDIDSGEDTRLSEIRMQSERVAEKGVYMLGVVRDGKLYFHPVSQTHQFRPTLTYMDVLTRPSRSAHAESGSDSDSDGDQDGLSLPTASPSKKASKASTSKAGAAKEIHAAVKRVDEKGGQLVQGGLTGTRREMLALMREEDEEMWENMEYRDTQAEESNDSFQSIFAKTDAQLICKSTLANVLQGVIGPS